MFKHPFPLKPASLSNFALIFGIFLSTGPAGANPGKPCPETGPGMTLVVSASGGADYRSIPDALKAARPGDTVKVKAGKYKGNISFPKSGTAGACIRLEGEQGAEISGGNRGITIGNKNYISVRGLTISNISGGETPIGISVTGSSSHIELKNNIVRRVTSSKNAHGIAFYGSSSKAMENLLIDGNVVQNCKLGQSEALVLNGNVDGFVISKNKVHDNDNIGIDIIGHEGTGPAGKDFARNGSIVNNEVWNNSSGRNPTYGGERSAGGIYVDGGRGIRIEGNNVRNCDIGIELASEHAGKTTEGIVAKNNTLSNSYQGNIMVGGYAANKGISRNILIEGNTLTNGRDGEIVLQHNNNGITIKGNTFRASKINIVATGSRNVNILVQGNSYARKPGRGDLGAKDGQMNMLHEEAIAGRRVSSQPRR
jgi:nitrous oxidase accessory protein NosD